LLFKIHQNTYLWKNFFVENTCHSNLLFVLGMVLENTVLFVARINVASGRLNPKALQRVLVLAGQQPFKACQMFALVDNVQISEACLAFFHFAHVNFIDARVGELDPAASAGVLAEQGGLNGKALAFHVERQWLWQRIEDTLALLAWGKRQTNGLFGIGLDEAGCRRDQHHFGPRVRVATALLDLKLQRVVLLVYDVDGLGGSAAH
ncbi:hypothetical protein BpHYR1_042915, partial [Brachionus plicatilis]